MAFYLSGAGGFTGIPACEIADWGVGEIFGFLKHYIKEGKLYATYHYTKNLLIWSKFEAPPFDFNS